MASLADASDTQDYRAIVPMENPMRLPLLLLALTVAARAHAGPIDDARLDYLDGNYEVVETVLLPAAEAGDPNAQNIVGDAYDSGKGVEPDPLKAREWWSRAAEQGFSKAQYNLGRLLSQGAEGIEPDYTEAERWLTAAMDQENGDAFNEMGRMWAEGRGREADPAKALEFYRKGAELGSRAAIANLGAAYAVGAGVDVDYARAFEHLSRAAAMGDPQALHNMGVLYENGYHVSTDKLAAVFYYSAALDAGYGGAAEALAPLLAEEGMFYSDPITALGLCLWVSGQAEANPIAPPCADYVDGMSEDDILIARSMAEEL